MSGTERSKEPRKRKDPPSEQEQREQRQRDQQKKQHQRQQEIGIEPSPPPYEVAETPLEKLGPGFAYLLGVVAGAFLLNMVVLLAIAGSASG